MRKALEKNTKWSVTRRKERTLGNNMQTRNNKVHDYSNTELVARNPCLLLEQS